MNPYLEQLLPFIPFKRHQRTNKIEYSCFFQDIRQKKLHVKKITSCMPSNRQRFLWPI